MLAKKIAQGSRKDIMDMFNLGGNDEDNIKIIMAPP